MTVLCHPIAADATATATSSSGRVDMAASTPPHSLTIQSMYILQLHSCTPHTHSLYCTMHHHARHCRYFIIYLRATLLFTSITVPFHVLAVPPTHPTLSRPPTTLSILSLPPPYIPSHFPPPPSSLPLTSSLLSTSLFTAPHLFTSLHLPLHFPSPPLHCPSPRHCSPHFPVTYTTSLDHLISPVYSLHAPQRNCSYLGFSLYVVSETIWSYV